MTESKNKAIYNSNFSNTANREDNLQKRNAEKLFPILIRDFHRMLETKPVNDSFQFNGQDVDRLQIIGRIVKIENDTTKIRVFIDDGTGIYMVSGLKKEGSLIPKTFMQIRIQLTY